MSAETNHPDPPAVILTSPDDLRKARLNQPRVSSEELRQQRMRIQRQVEECAERAKNETSKAGLAKTARG